MQVKVKKLHQNAIIPQYATDGAACFDLHSIDDGVAGYCEPATFRTGLAFEVPPGHAMMVYSRSGHGFKHGVRLGNGTGVLDSDYRGELMVRLVADGGGFLKVRKGDRIAQAMIVPVPVVEFVESDSLEDTERGECGFGSTGA